MIWVLLILIFVLLVLLLMSYLKNRAYRRELAYIARRLEQLVHEEDRGYIQVVTGSPELRSVLQGTNELLDYARRSADDYVRTELAMRKMLANISHDLKTPLTVVLGYAEALSRDNDMSEEERERLLGKIHQKSLDVLELMNKFFDLARLESGDDHLAFERFDAADLCRQRILAYYDILTHRGLEVAIDIPDKPVWIYANAESLQRILDNLISNAIRYGADGKFLGLTLRTEGEFMLIEVSDRGRGIQETEQSRVFERLYTLEDSRNREVQGSGLGLTITKRLAERMGGSIELESRPGIRTVFTVKLPSARA
ncbi:sensor histidine kinase [Paenibacillus medicaginis]|uniref:histidine kinase n=1 Tax=Paenibacillus medicaginis TaxID=1470560 RepID=A0ABV5C046_9BACL